MTTDQRLGRLERSVAILAQTVTRNHALRGEQADIDAVRELTAEVEALNADAANAERLAEMRRELAKAEAA